MFESLTSIAHQYYDVFLILHLFAMVLGLGGATYTDILLVRFLKDLRIDHKESDVIHTVSRSVFWGVLLALLSGVMLFLTKPDVLLATPKFQAKMLIFAVIMINGFFLHRIVMPRLIDFSFDREHYLVSRLIHLRHVGFIMGAISGVSWYGVFILGALSEVSLSFGRMMGIYGMVLVLGVVGALIIERHMKYKKR